MVSRKLSPIRKAQRKLLEGLGTIADCSLRTADVAGEQLKKLDERHGISDAVRDGGTKVASAIHDLNSEIGVNEKMREIGSVASETLRKTADIADRGAENAGVYVAIGTISRTTVSVLKQYGLDKRLEEIECAVEDLYGSTRQVIKPYFLPETPDELLSKTKKELTYISACIMQISPSEAEKLASQFGTVIVSKMAGIAASGVLLSLVSTFGTASTGTAIASLSGAASTSATFAWVGGLLGGGMATGAVLTGGAAIVVGLGAYKSLSSEKRNFEQLDDVEQRIVQYCWMLIAILDDYLEQKERTFTAGQARNLLTETLLPLQQLLENNEEIICANLDRKNSVAYRQHVLRDFRRAIVEPFEAFIEDDLANRTLHYEYVIGGVVFALLTNSVVDDSMESQLVLVAIRRSDPDLANASESDISSYLARYDEDQLKGIANNVKGIYHELLWVEQYNASHNDTRAELYEPTNHPGVDVRIVDVESGEIVAGYQLKATDNVA